MTVARRTLLQIALAAGAVVALATGLTYQLVFSAAEEQSVGHLRDYVRERAHSEQRSLDLTGQNLQLVATLFLQRDLRPPASLVEKQWEERNELHDDGAWRTRRAGYDGRRMASMWVGRNCDVTFKLKTRVLRAENILNDFIIGWVDSFPSLYFIFKDQVNVGYDPRIPNWIWQAGADYDTCSGIFYKLATPEKNPSRGIVWCQASREPISQQPYVSVTLPLYQKDEFIGVVGHDIGLQELLTDTSRTGIEGATHLIFRRDGKLIAQPGQEKRITESDGNFSLQESGDAGLAALHRGAAAQQGEEFSGYVPEGDFYYAAARLRGPDWIFASTMPRASLRDRAARTAQWVLWSGVLSVALALGIMSVILRRQVARPLAELSRATRRMGAGDTTTRASLPPGDELGALAAAFNEMAEAVAGRDAALERRVAERTAELSTANSRLAEASDEALRSLAREKELGEMKSRFVNTVSHEFRNPLAIILSCSDVLQRYDAKLAPEQRQRQLDGIKEAVHRMAGMMEEVLVLGRAEAGRLICEPREVDLAALCHRLIDLTLSATSHRCPVQFHHDPLPGRASVDQGLLQHILSNLLSNAVKYSSEGCAVDFHLFAENGEAVFRITDRGSGIPAEDLPGLYQPFHRGSNVGTIPGTGLGLVIVKRCVEIHGGTIHCESTPGEGTTFTVRLPLFPDSESDSATET